MTKATEQLLEQALGLDPTDRAELAERLDESVLDVEYQAEWDTEIRDRINSVLSGEEKPIPWREAMAQIRRGEMDGE